MITINDIARLAGVSRSTVSRYLNDNGYVGKEASERIKKVIDETGYIPSQSAQSLRTKKTGVIGIIVPKISTETASRLVGGMNEVLIDEGYQMLLADTTLDKEKEIEYLRLLQSRNVDGIILLGTNKSSRLIKGIEEAKVPVVVLGQDGRGGRAGPLVTGRERPVRDQPRGRAAVPAPGVRAGAARPRIGACGPGLHVDQAPRRRRVTPPWDELPEGGPARSGPPFRSSRPTVTSAAAPRSAPRSRPPRWWERPSR